MEETDRQNATDSPKVEVGEMDTRAPFQSVKDADLFGESAFSGEKPAIRKTTRVLPQETQLHLAQKELNKLEELLKNAENTKYPLLEKANMTVDELTQELKTVTESNDAAIKAPEAVKNKLAEAMGDNSVGNDRAQKQDMENKGEQYVTVIAELDAAEQSRQMH